MTSAFWGGFAQTMLDSNLRKEQRSAGLEDYEKKKNIDLKFETTEIDDVDKQGRPVRIKIDGNGEEVGRRYLTQSEAEARLLAKRELLARVAGHEADATLRGRQVEDYEEDRQNKRNDVEFNKKLRIAQLENSRSATASQNEARAFSMEQRSLMSQQRREADTARAEANSAETYAAAQLNKLANRLAQVPTSDDGTHKKTTLDNTRRRVQIILQSNKPNAQKKADIQALLDSVLIYLPEYSRQSTDTSSSQY